MAINVKDGPYNAVGDGIVDDFPVLQQAFIDAAATRQRVIVPYGKYRHTQQLDLNGVGIEVVGEGSGDKVAPFGTGALAPTSFYADYVSGAGLRIWQRNCSIKGIQFDSSEARKAAPFNVASAGIRIEPIDETNARVDWTYLEDVWCIGHPGDGIMFSGGEMVRSGIKRSGATNCRGHGIAIDADRTGRVDKSRPGQMFVEDCYVQRCHGNGLVIGSPSVDNFGLQTLPYRMRVINLEAIRLGTVGGPRFGAQAVWAYGEDMRFIECGFGGTDIDGVNGHLAGIYVAGRDIRLLDDRYIQTNRGVSVGSRSGLSTKDVIIDGAVVAQDTAALNPFCVIQGNAPGITGAVGVRIRAHATGEVTNWVHPSTPANVCQLDIV